MPSARLYIFFALIFAVLCANAGIWFFPKTIKWDEDVRLANGGTLLVHRTVTFSPDEWGRPGRGPMKAQSMRFAHGGGEIEWHYRYKALIEYLPDIIDIVDGMPVVVMPITGPACGRHSFPQQGLVAFGHKNGDWSPVDIDRLPKTLKVNLLRDTHAIQYWKEYMNKRITPAMKQELETSSSWGWTKAGASISEVSKYLVKQADSCARIHPLPNPKLAAVEKINAEAALNAGTLVGAMVSTSTVPELVPPEAFRRIKGTWMGSAYSSTSCATIVERIESMRHYENGGAWSFAGHTIFLRNGNQIPLPVLTRKSAVQNALDTVACDTQSIYVAGWWDKGQLMVRRFSQVGTIEDAWRVDFPGLLEFFPKSPALWDFSAAAERLTISFGTYFEPADRGQAGILDRRISYTVQLPQ